VTIKHDGPGEGRWTKYCHLNSVTVPVNNPDGTPHVVEVGDQIGTLGQTEAYCNDQNGVQHVHFAVSNTENGGWGCVVGANQANCIDPGSPPGEGSFDKGCAGTVTPNVEWVTTTGGATKLAKDYCTPEPRATTCGRLANLAGGPVCGPGYTNNCNQPVECGPCAGGQVCNGGGMCAAAATVNVQVYTGAGTISVKRNNGVAFTGDAGGPATGSTTTSLLFPFAVGDTYSFSAAPSSGNLFVKFCGDAACSITTTSNPFSGNITAPQGNVFGYFNPCDSDSRTCHLLSNLAGAQVCGRDWTNNCGQKVTCNCSSSTTQTCDQTPGSPTDGTCVNRSGALYGFFDCVVGCVPNCSGKNCGDDGCGGYCGSGTGTCPAGYVCSGGNCVIPPTCPTGTCNTSNATGWCGAGYYCNTSGIANGAANTLYYCSSAGGYATSPRYCNEECHFEPGLNDQCWEDTSSCSYWRNYYVYACGWDSVNGNPRINYSCYYGSKSIHQWCAPGRCAWGSVNDYCY